MKRVFIAALLSLASAIGHAEDAPLPTAAQVDLARYAGRWYEIARLPLFWERNCEADVTATYTLRDDGQIGVRNRCRTNDGFIESEGVARVADASGDPAKLEVRFAPDWLAVLPFVWADYWIVALDPDYRWALVGQPGREYLWILSRTPQLDAAVYARLVAQAAELGFDVSQLVQTRQSAGGN